MENQRPSVGGSLDSVDQAGVGKYYSNPYIPKLVEEILQAGGNSIELPGHRAEVQAALEEAYRTGGYAGMLKAASSAGALSTGSMYKKITGLAEREKTSGASGGMGDGEAAMREFAQHMMGPIDMNDPYVQSVIKASSGAAQTDARMRGIEGGYASGNVARGTMDALAKVGLQRQQIGLQALAGAEHVRMQDAQAAQYAYDQQYRAQMGQLQDGYNGRVAQAQGVGGLIGGAIGGIAGSFIGPVGTAGGVSIGSQLGAGIGGMTQGSGPPTLSYTPPSGPPRNRGGF